MARAIETYLSDEPDLADGPRLTAAAFAIAGPIAGDHVAMTNHPWAFSIAELRQHFQWDQLHVINDFTANSLALPHLQPADRTAIGGGEGVAGTPLGIVGPGSGLGAGGLVPHPTGWLPLPSEGGHVTMAPADAREGAVLDLMRRRFDHVSAERVLSGPGLVNLYAALAELDGVPGRSYLPAQITDPATGAADRHCREAVEMFCAMLGTVAGNLALTLGARGGVYIAGGIVPRLGVVFTESRFRRRFEQKGRLGPYLAAIPTYVVTHSTPAFLGLSALLREKAAASP
ncbi:MAG: glucokinase [Alphaproteobacteria bacterium]|nr:glucokinase [Alphaproteobacteria bacterium]